MSTDPGLRRLALGTLLSAFRGEQAPSWAVDLLAEGLAGHVLFGFNIVEREQLAALSASLHAAREGVLIGIDEEGGDVTRLAHRLGSPYPGNAALGALGDPAITRRVYRTIGAELDELGLNLNLAPTVDVNTADDNPIIGTRSFGADPQAVAAHAAAAVLGLQSAGVAACAKHFPGHGATLADSHLELPTVDIDPAVLRARELPPFVAAIEAGTKSIMTAHIRVPALTGDAPATFSRAVLVDLLRDELGFGGVVVTDALEMLGAARYAGGVPAGAVLALAAGADLLCIGADVDEALTLACADEIVAAVRDGRLPAARLEEAAARVQALAAWTRSGARTDREEPGLGYPAALGAIRIEGSVDRVAAPLIVQLESESSIAAGRVPWGLGPHINGTEQVRVVADRADIAALRTQAGSRPIVVVGRNVHRLPGARALVEALTETHPVTVVEMGWPSSWRPTGAKAFITTWGASHANGRAAAETLGLAA
ncbi:glycoside hydrolase family 3 N-terminal domain-containing protein [Dactylosporangium sp. AC04546]|uniref:glycoside hydrolase family 3 protein n=1 Tax=Dactylosporangium sp. AC04546 TaxID=2862460 RepID=UPI001EDD7C65|nr:glycoside hydrolase family 3 N-terminal domain-containing protein [Dactylosporangium sp. AC04546]WVK85125.1 glycoside hydrolase family 3 N-terminal domain-containing protein [Dactylosporangium sp. AC04546]